MLPDAIRCALNLFIGLVEIIYCEREMNRSTPRTLLVYSNIHSLPPLREKHIVSVIAKDDEETKKCVLSAKKFRNVIIFRLLVSINGTYVRLPLGQRMGLMDSMLDFLEKSGFEVGAYSAREDACIYRSVLMNQYGSKKRVQKIYEIVAPSIESINASYNFLVNRLGDKH